MSCYIPEQGRSPSRASHNTCSPRRASYITCRERLQISATKMAASSAVIRDSAISAKFGGEAANLAELALRRMTARYYVM